MPHRPRNFRDVERARRAAAAARLQGLSAMAAALRAIEAGFNDAAAINTFKLQVERLVRLGPGHPAVRARFGARAELLRGRSLGTAIILVERWWRDERKAFQIASVLGRGNRISIETLRELRLILRLMRSKRMDAQLDAILSALCGDGLAAAAE